MLFHDTCIKVQNQNKWHLNRFYSFVGSLGIQSMNSCKGNHLHRVCNDQILSTQVSLTKPCWVRCQIGESVWWRTQNVRIKISRYFVWALLYKNWLALVLSVRPQCRITKSRFALLPLTTSCVFFYFSEQHPRSLIVTITRRGLHRKLWSFKR